MKKLLIIVITLLLITLTSLSLSLPIFGESIQIEEVSINDWLTEHLFTVNCYGDENLIWGELKGYEIRFMNNSLYINARKVMDVTIEYRNGKFYNGVDELNELYSGELTIIGNWKFVDGINSALKRLKEYPEEYEIVKNISNISCGMHGLAYLNLNSITLSMDDLYGEERLMVTILHEATHISDYKNGIRDFDQLETNAYKAQRAFWIELGAKDYEITRLDEGFKRKYWRTFWEEEK